MRDGRTQVFDCFECAILAVAPVCDVCGSRITSRGIKAGEFIFCSLNCAHIHDGTTDAGLRELKRVR